MHLAAFPGSAAFPGFLLSSLGRRFLGLLYAEAASMGEIALVACADGEVLGVAMGSARPGAFFGTLLRRRAAAFAWAAVPGILRRPAIAIRVARALRMPRDAAKPEGTATLMYLATAPAAQRLGVGKALVEAFLSEAARRGSRRVDLTTDKVDNERTNRFYTRLGFHVARVIVNREGRVLNEYEIDLHRS